METISENASAKTTWMLVFVLVLLIFAKGFFAFFMVGDNGQPSWEYRPVMDVPGESAYAIYDVMPYPQHVKGSGGE